MDISRREQGGFRVVEVEVYQSTKSPQKQRKSCTAQSLGKVGPVLDRLQ